jgi:ferrous iron transport protein A
MIHPPKPLADLSPGQSGTVSAIGGRPEVRHRLMEMGLTRGTAVKLLRVAPLGDPLEFQVRGYRLSLRRAEAADIVIEAC